MRFFPIIVAFATPYVVAWLVAVAIQRIRFVPPQATAGTIAQNELGRLTASQRRALLGYHLPEIVFSLLAIVIAVVWQPDSGINGTVLRWGLGGMAFVRLGLLWPVLQDVFGGTVASLSGPLRKIQFRQRRALATEDGPIVVLPVEPTLFDAHEAGAPATIYFAPHSRQVVAVISNNVFPMLREHVPSPALPES